MLRRKDCTPSGMIIILAMVIILGWIFWVLLKG